MKTYKNNINTGILLNDYLYKNKISQAALARELNLGDMSVLNYRKNATIQTKVLIQICYALRHNFFQDIADFLPVDFTKSDTFLYNKKIETLEEEIKILKIQNEILIKINSK